MRKSRTARELSAIGYVFARRVHKASNVPIGVIDASRGGTTVETWTPLLVLRAMGSEPTKAKLTHFDEAVAAWDPQADLDNRIAQHRQWIERQTKEGKPIPDDKKQPMLVGMEKRDGALLLKLDTDVSDPEDGAIQGFAIAGEDRRFHPADVAYAEKGKDDRGRMQYDRKQLILTSPMVPEPTHYRYAWGRNPLANLQATGNKDLPFGTQRSDDWRMEEVPLGVLGDEVTLPLSGGDRNKIIQALREQDRQRRLKEAEQLIMANGGTQSPG